MRKLRDVVETMQNYGLSEQDALKLYQEIEEMVVFVEREDMSTIMEQNKGIIKALSNLGHSILHDAKGRVALVEFIESRAQRIKKMLDRKSGLESQ